LFTDLLVRENSFRDLISNAHHGVQSSHRLLEDHGDLVATQTAHFFCGKLKQVA